MGNGRRRDEEVDGHSSSRNLRKIDNAGVLNSGPDPVDQSALGLLTHKKTKILVLTPKWGILALLCRLLYNMVIWAICTIYNPFLIPFSQQPDKC